MYREHNVPDYRPEFHTSDFDDAGSPRNVSTYLFSMSFLSHFFLLGRLKKRGPDSW